MTQMFNPTEIKKHIGTAVKYRPQLTDLEPVEYYFRSACAERGVEVSYDCTADENTYFRTLNYTNFAGMLIMHPLQFSMSMFQMYDAKADRLDASGHLDWIKEGLQTNRRGKYVNAAGEEFSSSIEGDIEAVMVLPGSNKFYEFVHKERFIALTHKHGKQLVVKPHPITSAGVLKDVKNFTGNAQFAKPHDNLYDLMERANIVYTTHISETAVTGLLLGKKVKPIDIGPTRLTGSFSHINHFAFSEANPLETLGSIFASPKSGVVHPDIDTNWRQKIDLYLDYILTQRELQKGHYL